MINFIVENIRHIIKDTHWEVYWKSKAESPSQELMSDTAATLLLVSIFLTFVLRIGPAFMEKRPPYKLKYLMLFYNISQVVASIYLGQRSLAEMAEYGYLPGKCQTTDDSFRIKVAFGIWLFFLAKFSELLDTVFFILRKKKKQLSFLHIFHHSIMLFSFIIFRRDPSHFSSFIRFLNSVVHTAMYAYYALSALGPKYAKYRTCKKYITIFQLVQFVIGVGYCLLEQFSDCPTSKGHNIGYVSVGFFFFLLFSNFYRNNYMGKHPKEITNSNSVTNTLQVKDEKSQ